MARIPVVAGIGLVIPVGTWALTAVKGPGTKTERGRRGLQIKKTQDREWKVERTSRKAEVPSCTGLQVSREARVLVHFPQIGRRSLHFFSPTLTYPDILNQERRSGFGILSKKKKVTNN